jgi:prepilin-type N-terminal cleavage/methylation domain-containing protein
MKRRGFTIVELVVVMTIMAILLGLGIFGLQKSQADARDAERRSDVEAMSRGLEERYKNGNPVAWADDGSHKAGQYPGVNEMFHVAGWGKTDWHYYYGDLTGKGYWEEEFAGVTRASFVAPNGKYIGMDCVWYCQPAGTASQIWDAINAEGNKAGDGVRDGRYVYEPVDANGNICCCTGCVRFDIYYLNEAGTLVKVSSQNQ